MKNRSRLCGIIALFAIIGMMFTACPGSDDGTNDTGQTPAAAEKTALIAKINEAKSEKNGVQAAAYANEVPLGLHWVTSAEMTAFNSAISTAEAVNNNANAAQATVNAAVVTLDTAISVFKQAKKAGTNADNIIHLDALNAAITNAGIAKTSAATASSADQVALGAYWVTSTVMTALENAITAANGIKNNPANQTAVDSAVTALNNAISTFNNARQAGTKTEFSADELTAKINEAKAGIAGVTASTDGNNIAPGSKWTDQQYITALDDAITSAEAADETNRNDRYLALSDALVNFIAYLKSGNAPDKSSLLTAIQAAYTATNGVVAAASAAQALLDSKWATQTDIDNFEAAIETAMNVNSNNNATVNMVNSAKTTIENATSAFNNLIISNGPGTYVPPVPSGASITITGLNTTTYPNDTWIEGGLSKTTDFGMNEKPEIFGYGQIKNGTAVIELFNNDNDETPWTGSDSWYFGFMIENENKPLGFEVFISKSMINFSANPNPTVPFTNFQYMVFSMTFGELVEMNGGEPISGSVTLNSLVNGDYDAWALEMGVELFANSNLTGKFTGTSTITASTKFYTITPFWMGGGGGDNRGEKIGEITGSINLTNIPAGASVYISVYGHNDGGGNNWTYFSTWSERIINPVNSNNSFTIPLHEGYFSDNNNNQVSPYKTWNCTFGIYVQLSNDNGYSLRIPQNIDLSGYSGSAIFSKNVGNITGSNSLDIGYVTLSGTINITYNGSPVNRLAIDINSVEGGYGLGGVNIYPTTASANWTAIVSKSSIDRDIRIQINGLPNKNSNWDERLFVLEYYDTIPANNGKTINIDIGNIVSGSMNIKNPPEGNHKVYITKGNINSNSYYGIIAGDYSAYGEGTSSVIPLSWNRYDDIWYNVMVISGNEVRYLYSTNFYNKTGIIDWNKMSVLQGVEPVENIVSGAMNIINLPTGTYKVYITDNYWNSNDYYSIIAGDYYAYGAGTGSAIPLSWNDNQKNWYSVIVISNTEVRYFDNTNIPKQTGIIDWNKMSVLQGLEPVVFENKVLSVQMFENWSGFELNHNHFNFQVGDVIEIKGKNMASESQQILINRLQNGWWPLGSTGPGEGKPYVPYVDPGQEFDYTFTLIQEDVTDIIANSSLPEPHSQSIRIRGNIPNSFFIIERLVVKRSGAELLNLTTHLNSLSANETDWEKILPASKGLSPVGGPAQVNFKILN